MSVPAVRRSPRHEAVVVASSALTPRMQRVTVACATLAALDVRPAQDVELHLSEPNGRRVKRRYTIRAARAAATGTELDLDVLLHGGGAGAEWARLARPGDEVQFQGPRGKLELRPATQHLLVGDESALPAIATICEALAGSGSRLTALVEVRDAADELPVPATTRWVHRGAAQPGGAQLLTAALAGIGVDAGTRAYLLGETRAMVTLRGVVEGLGVGHDDVFVKGYWNLGRPDRLTGRTPG